MKMTKCNQTSIIKMGLWMALFSLLSTLPAVAAVSLGGGSRTLAVPQLAGDICNPNANPNGPFFAGATVVPPYPPNLISPYVVGVNDAGDVVIQAWTSGNTGARIFVYKQSTGTWKWPGTPMLDGATEVRINNAGIVFGKALDPYFGYFKYDPTWGNGTVTSFSSLLGGHIYSMPGMSDNMEAGVSSDSQGKVHTALWSNPTQPIDLGMDIEPRAINNNGAMVYLRTPGEAIVLDPAYIPSSPIHVPSGGYTNLTITGITINEDVFGSYWGGFGYAGQHPAIWKKGPSGNYTLIPFGLVDGFVTGLNDQGFGIGYVASPLPGIYDGALFNAATGRLVTLNQRVASPAGITSVSPIHINTNDCTMYAITNQGLLKLTPQ